MTLFHPKRRSAAHGEARCQYMGWCPVFRKEPITCGSRSLWASYGPIARTVTSRSVERQEGSTRSVPGTNELHQQVPNYILESQRDERGSNQCRFTGKRTNSSSTFSDLSLSLWNLGASRATARHFDIAPVTASEMGERLWLRDALRSAPAKCHGGTWHRKIPREPFNRYSKHRCY